VQVAKEEWIDLVIMDVGLPDIDGREAARILRRHSFNACRLAGNSGHTVIVRERPASAALLSGSGDKGRASGMSIDPGRLSSESSWHRDVS
jgi:CheY-like chemotaxis protein